jgi:hypothetical protein
MLMAKNGARNSRGEATPKRRASKAATMELQEPNGVRQHIERRAYEIYQARGGSHGSDLDDWLQAERELRQREPVG